MIILNTFNWFFKDIASKSEFFKYQGIDAVQTSPITNCKLINEQYVDNEWWKLYQNLGFDIGNRLGTKQDFKELCDENHRNGLLTFPDIVLRHVASKDNGECKPHKDVDPRLLPFILDNREHLKNDKNRYDVVNGSWGLPMLDYNNPELQEKFYIPFLDEVFDLGADGFRLDEGKHYALEHENGTIWDNVFSRYKDKFIYGECINCQTDILNHYAKKFYVLTDNWANMGRGSVRFFESHDTYHHSWGNTRQLNNQQRLEKFRDLCRKHHNVMFFTRPGDDDFILSKEFRDVCIDPLNMA